MELCELQKHESISGVPVPLPPQAEIQQSLAFMSITLQLTKCKPFLLSLLYNYPWIGEMQYSVAVLKKKIRELS